MCSQQLPKLHRINNFLISKTYFTEFHSSLHSKNYLLVEVTYLLIRLRLSSSQKTKNTD